MTRRQNPWRCARCGISDGDRDNPRSKLCGSCASALRAAGQWWCVRCGQARPQAEFATVFQCAACLSKKAKDWRAEHADDQKRYRQAYYAEHQDDLKAYRDAYYASNRDDLLAQKQIYYEAHREEIKSKVRERRPHRRAASIQREQARQVTKRADYKTREKVAARITLVTPITAVDDIQCSARPNFPEDLLQWVPDRTHLITDRAASPAAGWVRPCTGRLLLVARQRPCTGASTEEARRGGSYYLILAEGAEARYLAVWSGGSAGAAPTLTQLRRPEVPRKVVDHAQVFLRDLAARGSPLAPPQLRAVLIPDRRARSVTTKRRSPARRSLTEKEV